MSRVQLALRVLDLPASIAFGLRGRYGASCRSSSRRTSASRVPVWATR
ncbi:hypothetical protein ACFYRN_42055 [Streptomyces sp. NPDC005227]